MRLPRKLKKGCCTLKGHPRTKWQRKGQLHIARQFMKIAAAANVLTLVASLRSEIVKSVNPFRFPPGGVVVPPTPSDRMMVGESTGEIVLHRPQLDRLQNTVSSFCEMKKDICVNLSEVSLSEILKKTEYKKSYYE